jgi:hypothetical protein
MLERLILLTAATLAGSQAAAADSASARIIVQHAPLAGFVYYDGKDIWDQIRVGDRLSLVREPANPHDVAAVRLEWRGRRLGYVPRKDNADLARQMDNGAPVEARVTELRLAGNGRHRISYEIYVTLQ